MKTIKKAQDGWVAKAACRRGVCGKGSVSDKRAARMDKKEERRSNKEAKRDERQAAKEQRMWERRGLRDGGGIKKAIFGIGLGKEERQARREQRQYRREDRQMERQSRENMRNCNKGRCGMNRLEGGGKMKKAQTGKLLKYTTPSGNRVTMDTTGYAAGKKKFPTKVEGSFGGRGTISSYGMSGRKSTSRAIESSQGKPYRRQGMKPFGAKAAKKTLNKSKSGSKISKKK